MQETFRIDLSCDSRESRKAGPGNPETGQAIALRTDAALAEDGESH
jgi:hypothetical protein